MTQHREDQLVHRPSLRDFQTGTDQVTVAAKTQPPEMESPPNGESYEAVKTRIDEKLTHLKSELQDLRSQDVLLLKQLLHIHVTIRSLAGYREPYRRSYSSSNVGNSAENSPLPVRAHTPLGRNHSAPLKDDDDEVLTDNDEVPVYLDDKLSWSFGSYGSGQGWISNIDVSLSDSLPSLSGNVQDASPFTKRKRCSVIIEEHPSSDDSVKSAEDTHDIDNQSYSKDNDDLSDLSSDSGLEFSPTNLQAPTEEKRTRSPDLSQYEMSYENMLRRSSRLWREIQTDKETNGFVDKKKIATLKLFL